jgi:hypothetical protein
METGKAQFSIEPFIKTDNRFITWADVSAKASDADDYLPIPSVTWTASPIELKITSFASGAAGSSILFGRYQVRNHTAQPRKATL